MRGRITWWMAGLVGVGLVTGVVLVSLMTWSVNASSTENFCATACHSMQWAAEAWENGPHYNNPQALHATCSDCHIPFEIKHPTPYQYVTSLLRTKVTSGLTDVWGTLRGELADKAMWDAEKPQMRAKVHAWFAETNSQTCRECHDLNSLADSSTAMVASVHSSVLKTEKIVCIECHGEVAHVYKEAQGDVHTEQTGHAASPSEEPKLAMKIPDPPTTYPDGELGTLVKLGEAIFLNTNTHPLTKDLVGNTLTCNSCHLDGGKTKTIGSLIGSATSFPAYSPREKTVQTLQDRNDNCFMRSMNGIRPAIDSQASLALMAYVSWLSEGIPLKMNPKKPINIFYSELWPGAKWVVPLVKQSTHENYLAGKKIWEQRCTECHEEGLWGDQSYNAGAGMSNLNKAPVWILYNMPPTGEKLTQREAVDVNLYINAQPRPDFDLQKHLPPASEGLYNTAVTKEKHSVRSHFEKFGLDVDEIRGDKLIP